MTHSNQFKGLGEPGSPMFSLFESEPSFGGICTPPHPPPSTFSCPDPQEARERHASEDQWRHGRQDTGINNPKSQKQKKDKHLDRESDTCAHTHTSPNRHSVYNKANIIYQHFMTILEEGIPKPVPWSKGWTLEIHCR